MFGGLHIEMAAMTGVLTEAGVASSRMADSFCLPPVIQNTL